MVEGWFDSIPSTRDKTLKNDLLTSTKAMGNNDEYVDDVYTSSEDVKDEERESSEEDTKDWKAEALKQKAIAERLSKKINQPKADNTKTNTSDNGLTRDEIILYAQGTKEEEMEQIRVIAKGKDISLSDAKKDPMFTVWKQSEEQKKASENAQLGASRGATHVKGEKPFGEMTRSEHEAKFRALVE